jgi:hypothetical protein
MEVHLCFCRKIRICEFLKLRPKETIRNLWDKFKAFMIFVIPVTNAYLSENADIAKPASG